MYIKGFRKFIQFLMLMYMSFAIVEHPFIVDKIIGENHHTYLKEEKELLNMVIEAVKEKYYPLLPQMRLALANEVLLIIIGGIATIWTEKAYYHIGNKIQKNIYRDLDEDIVLNIKTIFWYPEPINDKDEEHMKNIFYNEILKPLNLHQDLSTNFIIYNKCVHIICELKNRANIIKTIKSHGSFSEYSICFLICKLPNDLIHNKN